jgi:uncharacterized protein YbjT (DUF2867 family)
MKVALAGGHGKIALRLARLLAQRGDEVRSIIRKAEQSDDVREAGAEPVLADLEKASANEAAEAVGSVDAVVFAAGAGPGSGPERKWTVDYGAAVKLIEAAKAAGVDRYVMVSSIGADPAKEGDDTFSVYLRAKGQADADLQQSGLVYTIVRPASLTDEPGGGRVRIAAHVGGGQVSRDDVAGVLAAVLHTPATAGHTFEVASGEVPIEQALAAFVGSAASP